MEILWIYRIFTLAKKVRKCSVCPRISKNNSQTLTEIESDHLVSGGQKFPADAPLGRAHLHKSGENITEKTGRTSKVAASRAPESEKEALPVQLCISLSTLIAEIASATWKRGRAPRETRSRLRDGKGESDPGRKQAEKTDYSDCRRVRLAGWATPSFWRPRIPLVILSNERASPLFSTNELRVLKARKSRSVCVCVRERERERKRDSRKTGSIMESTNPSGALPRQRGKNSGCQWIFAWLKSMIDHLGGIRISRVYVFKNVSPGDVLTFCFSTERRSFFSMSSFSEKSLDQFQLIVDPSRIDTRSTLDYELSSRSTTIVGILWASAQSRFHLDGRRFHDFNRTSSARRASSSTYVRNLNTGRAMFFRAPFSGRDSFTLSILLIFHPPAKWKRWEKRKREIETTASAPSFHLGDSSRLFTRSEESFFGGLGVAF